MSYQRERDEFIARCHLSTDTARALLRHATTLHRLAEAQCNGDWPCDNGQRETAECLLCGSYWVPSQIQGGPMARAAWEHNGAVLNGPRHSSCRACPDCRTEARVRALLAGTQWQPYFQGDPRGYALKLFPHTHRVDDQTMPVTHDDMCCGRVQGLGVPTK